MLLALEVGQFPVLHYYVSAASETAGSDVLPTCLGVDKVPCPLPFGLWPYISLSGVVQCIAMLVHHTSNTDRRKRAIRNTICM
jgi:hypothetical protein